jgi:acetyl esterase/lipase
MLHARGIKRQNEYMLHSLILALLVAEPKADLDITYAKPAGEELKMDVYSPALSPVGEKLPAVVVIHGGAWMSGKRQDMAAMAKELANRGVVAATIQYRLAPKYQWPAMLDDAQTAVRYLRANSAKYNIDPKRIGATGASAGGHLALFLGATETRDKNAADYPKTSSKVKAVLDLFGPTDLTNATDFPPGPLTQYMAVTLFGKKPDDTQGALEAARTASPLYFLDKNAAPVFIIQGLADTLVKPNQSKALEAKLKTLKVPVEAVYIDQMGHELPLQKEPVKQAAERGLAWLIAQLKR